MKVSIEIECSPEEARQFFGLPSVAGMQDQMMNMMQEKMEENIKSMDAEAFMQTWMPMTIKGWADIQKSFLDQMAASRGTTADNKTKT